MPTKLQAALRRFSEQAPQVEQLILRDRDFRSLCEDYGDAVAALERWSSSTQAIAPHRTAEYRKLVEDLENEIRASLGRFIP